MNIKNLETKLQTILENDNLEITEENIAVNLGEAIAEKVCRFAVLNDAVSEIEYFKDEYISRISDEGNAELFDLATESLKCLCGNECYNEKTKVLDVMQELFINQDFYDLMNNNFPAIRKLVDKLNDPKCIFDIDDIIEWIRDGFDIINTEDIQDLTIYQYLNREFEDFNTLYVPNESVKVVKNSEEGAEDEGRGSN